MSSSDSEPCLIDQCRCPECGQTCLQKNIYRHMTTAHEWNREDCKVLVNAIRTEKKGREAKTTFLCAYCRAMFRSIRHLVQHNRICTAQPEVHDNDDTIINTYLDEMIVGQEEEVVSIEEYIEVEEDIEKPSTSTYETEVPPHRQPPRGIPAHHLPPPSPTPPKTPKRAKIEEEKCENLTFQPLGSRHRASQTKCPQCSVTVESIEDLLTHCHQKHETEEQKFFVETESFETRREFKKWFDQRQEDTCTSLTKRTGHGGETLYRCHRIGKYQSVAKARKSNPRKIDQTCTAYLKVFTRDGDGTTWATGCFTHIGHELDHKLLWLTETQENYVRELIDLGWTADQIFFYIREEYKSYECKLKYISKNDIRNITVRYNREKSFQKPPEESEDVENPPAKRSEEEIVVVDSEEYMMTSSKEEEEAPPPLLPTSSENDEDVTPSIGTTSEKPTVEEENEYINVVDDEPLPRLERMTP